MDSGDLVPLQSTYFTHIIGFSPQMKTG